MTASTAPRRIRAALRVFLALAAAWCALGLGAAGTPAMADDMMPAAAAVQSADAHISAADPMLHDTGAANPAACPHGGKGQTSTCTGLTAAAHSLAHPLATVGSVRTPGQHADPRHSTTGGAPQARGPSPGAGPGRHALNVLRV